jgi:hypothetical protein
MSSIQFKLFSLNWLRLVFAFFLLSPVLAFGASGDVIEFRADSPQRYQVVQGDTLWDISERFLEAPWLWPEVWQSNPQINNPDLIYPGDTIELVYVDGQPRLTLNRERIENQELAVVRLSPQIRREPLRSPIPAIALEDIDLYLSRNRIADVAEINNAPNLIGSQTGRRFSSEGDIVYAVGDWDSQVSTYEIVRPESEVVDRVTGEVVGFEAVIVGTASIVSREGNQASLVVDTSIQEVDIGDKLIPGTVSVLASTYFPVPPSFELIPNAQVVDINFGKSFGGVHDTVLLNVGRSDGLEIGHLLTIQKADHEIVSDEGVLTFTGEKYGRVLIYKVFRDHTLALVLNSDQAVYLSDRVVRP